MALSHVFFLDSVLSFSALHLAFLEVNDRHWWLQTALKYQNKASSAFHRSLTDIGPHDCEATFQCSIFILLFAAAYQGVSRDSHILDPVSEILSQRKLVEGCALLRQSNSRFQGEGFRRRVERDPADGNAEGSLNSSPNPSVFSLMRSASHS